MRAAAEIQRLIQRLSTSERRYFRMAATQGPARPPEQYLLLYDFLATTATLTEPAWAEFLAAHPDTARFASQNLHYLRDALLRSLRAFHARDRVTHQLRDMLSEVELLTDKGLHEDALRHLAKLEKKARHHGHTLVHIEALDLKSVLLKQFRKARLQDALDDLRTEKATLLARLDHEQSLSDLYNQVYALQAGESRARDLPIRAQVEALLQHPLLQDGPPRSFQAEHLRLQTLLVAHHILAQSQQAHQLHAAAVLLWEAHPQHCAEQPDKFMRLLANALASCFECEDLAPVPARIARLRALCAGQPHHPAWRSIYYYEVMLLMQQARYAEAAVLLPGIEAWIAQHPQLTPITWLLPMWFNFLSLAFIQGEWARVLHWARTIDALAHTQVRREIARAVRLLTLVAHFERGDDDLVHYLSRAASSQLQQQAATLRFERTLIRFLGRQIAKPLPDRRAQDYLRLQQQLAALRSHPEEIQAPAFEEICMWAARQAGR